MLNHGADISNKITPWFLYVLMLICTFVLSPEFCLWDFNGASMLERGN